MLDAKVCVAAYFGLELRVMSVHLIVPLESVPGVTITVLRVRLRIFCGTSSHL